MIQSLAAAQSKNTKKIDNQDKKIRQVVSTIKSTGDISKAAKRLESTANIADINDQSVTEQLNTLLTRDTSRVFESTHVPINEPCPVITPDLLRRAVTASSNSSSGITGFHHSHLVALIDTLDGCKALTEIANLILSKQVPNEIFTILTTSTLLPLVKPNGKIRPILIGDVLIRTIGKCCTLAEQQIIADRLAPIQLAVGTKCGNEVAIHGIRAHLDSNPDHVLITVDIANAFGTISRNAVAQSLNNFQYDDSKYTRWFFNHFGCPPSVVLLSNGSRFEYTEGVPQGGPLSMQWFCLALQPMLEFVNQTLQPVGGRLIAYADDIFLLGKPEDAFAAFHTLKHNVAQVGLRLQPDKCKVMSLLQDTTEINEASRSHGINDQCAPALLVLGTPVGSEAGERRLTSTMTDSNIFSQLEQVPDLQCRTLLLRFCVSARFNHYGRTMCPTVAFDYLQYIDHKVDMSLISIVDRPELLHTDRFDLFVAEAALPLSHGGLGLRRLSTQCSTDYYSSASSALLHWRNTAVSSNDAIVASLASVNTRSGNVLSHCLEDCHKLKAKVINESIIPTPDDPSTPESWLPAIKHVQLPPTIADLLLSTSPHQEKIQRYLTLLHARNTFRNVWNQLPQQSAHRVQLIAKTTRMPTLPLLSIPTEEGLTLSNINFRLLVTQLLSLSLESVLGLPGNSVRCCCSKVNTHASSKLFSGNHIFNCGYDSAFTTRHNAIMQVISDSVKSTGLKPAVEVVVSTPPNIGVNMQRLSEKRYDIVIPPVSSDSKNICVDVTVTSHLTIEHFGAACQRPLVNANNAATAKHNKYKRFVDRDREFFLPLASETSGALHTNFFKLFAILGARVNNEAPAQAPWSAPSFTSYWMQRTSITLYRETYNGLLNIARQSLHIAGREDDHLTHSVIDDSVCELPSNE